VSSTDRYYGIHKHPRSGRLPREAYLLAGVALALPPSLGLLALAVNPPEPPPAVCRCEAPPAAEAGPPDVN